MTNPLSSISASSFWSGSEDFTVTTAMSAYEAIRLLEKERFDTIISDYLMPGMDGIQFLVEVRTRLGPIPFILFTGRERREIIIQAINCLARHFYTLFINIMMICILISAIAELSSSNMPLCVIARAMCKRE